MRGKGLKKEGKMIQYYAIALNNKDKIEQLLVTRKNGKPFSQEWMGKIYKTTKEAKADLIRLNCQS